MYHRFNENKYLEQVINFAKTENAKVVAICADIEEDISKLDILEKKEYLEEIKEFYKDFLNS